LYYAAIALVEARCTSRIFHWGAGGCSRSWGYVSFVWF